MNQRHCWGKTWTKAQTVHLLCSVTLAYMVKGNAGQPSELHHNELSSVVAHTFLKIVTTWVGTQGLAFQFCAQPQKLCIKAEQTAVLSLQPTHVPAVSRAALPEWIQPVAAMEEAHWLLFTHQSTIGCVYKVKPL